MIAASDNIGGILIGIAIVNFNYVNHERACHRYRRIALRDKEHSPIWLHFYTTTTFTLILYYCRYSNSNGMWEIITIFKPSVAPSYIALRYIRKFYNFVKNFFSAIIYLENLTLPFVKSNLIERHEIIWESWKLRNEIILRVSSRVCLTLLTAHSIRKMSRVSSPSV